MIHIIDHRKMGKSEQGWLHSIFHFSFAEYYNPSNMNFGALRVVNDDIFDAGKGFETHPHQDMEIISYVVEGVLTHKDSMDNERQLTRGQVQYMSAGTGITHSEINHTKNPLRFLQIWVLPDKKGYEPNYGDYRFNWEEREDKWLLIASDETENAPIKIHQDMNISVVSLSKGKMISYEIEEKRQVYLILIEGEGQVNEKLIHAKDAVEITEEKKVTLKALKKAHYILFDMKKK